MRGMLYLCAAVFVFIASGIHLANAATVSAKNPDEIVNIAKGYGFAVLEKTETTGNPKVSGKIDGVKYSIIFYGCKNGQDCDSIQFSTGWRLDESNQPSISTINKWNKEKRFGKAYIDSEGDPRLEIDLPLSEVPVSYLERYFDWWEIALRGFKKEVLQK